MSDCRPGDVVAPPDTSVRANAARVRFDFEGSLALARKLWAFADEVEGSRATRAQHATTAQAVWRGVYADQFVVRMEDEVTSRVHVVHGLREEARGWATAWTQAMDEQNRRNRAAAVDAERESRDGWEKFGDHFVGDDSDEQVAKVGGAATPQPPLFTATMTEATFG